MEKSVEFYMEMGKAEAAAGNYCGARGAYAKAIRIDPSNAQAYCERGKVGILGDCLEYYQKAIELDPSIADAYWGIIKNYLIFGYSNDEHIVNLMMKYIALKPNEPEAYRNMATAYGRLKKYHDMIDNLTIAIDLDLQAKDSDYHNRGRCYYRVRKYGWAITDLSKAITMNPKNPVSYELRGCSYARLHKFDLAIPDFTSAIEKYEKMMEDKDMEYIVYPDTAEKSLIRCYAERGMCYDQKASDDFVAVLGLGERHCINDRYIGLCYHKIGLHEQAIKRLDDAIWDRYQEDGCLFSEAFKFRGDSYEAIGDLGKRDQDYHAAKIITDLEENAPDKVFKLKYDRTTDTIIFDDVA